MQHGVTYVCDGCRLGSLAPDDWPSTILIEMDDGCEVRFGWCSISVELAASGGLKNLTWAGMLIVFELGSHESRQTCDA